MKTMLYLAARAMTVTVALLAFPAVLPSPCLVHAQDEAIADEENLCIQCHGNTDLWEGTRSICWLLHSRWRPIFIGKKESNARHATVGTQPHSICVRPMRSRMGFAKLSPPRTSPLLRALSLQCGIHAGIWCRCTR